MESSDWIAISAAIIALFSSLAVIWQGFLSREYYRLSTKPHLTIERKSNFGAPETYILSNDGLGPAIIEEFYLKFDGVYFEGGDEIINKILGLLCLKKGECEYMIPSRGEALRVSKEMTLFHFQNIGQDDTSNLRQLNECLSFKIVYSSIYGEKYEYEGSY
ncbi:hypothetical protein ACN9RQ_004633 [Vibrio parahaemolyticus]|nr:hypothetical protein [Vibrio parahaemolyticus]